LTGTDFITTMEDRTKPVPQIWKERRRHPVGKTPKGPQGPPDEEFESR